MISTTVQLIDPVQPSVTVLAIDDGRRFLSLHLGPDATVILSGFNAASVTEARAIAQALLIAADDLQAQLDAKTEGAEQAVQS